MARPVVALLTDFGTRDPFVGVMKGVVLARCPEATLVDLTHEIPPQAVAEGAFWLERAAPFFPEGTVFIGVVDPGVGTARRGVVVVAAGRLFVGPDNGLLEPAASTDAGWLAHEIDPAALGLASPSRTFHGRDVFAPVAAELASRRLRASDAGPRCKTLAPGSVPKAVLEGGTVTGTVVTVDRFGNLITNIAAAEGSAGIVAIAGRVFPLQAAYSDVETGQLVALVNAWGVVEVAERDGDAARSLGIGRGAAVGLQSRPLACLARIT